MKKYFLENLDTVACISGIVFGILITSLYLKSKTIHLLMLGLALTLASLVYLLTKNRKQLSGEYVTSTITSTIKIILEIIFFSLFSMSIWVLHIYGGRSFLYFVIISISTGFLALSVLNIKSKFDTALQIVKIFMISFNLKYSIFIFFAGSGVDYWTHLKMNSILAQEGFIDVLFNQEQFFPLMHIQTTVHQIITITPIREATNFAIILPLVISSIGIFLVARKIFDEKIGLIAMLIMNITDYHTYWGSAPQTTTFGICLFFFLIFVLFQMTISNQNRIIWSTLVIIFFVSLILSHAVSSFILLITIIGLFVGSYANKKFYDNHAAIFPPILFLCLYCIFLVQHWFIAIYNQMSENSFFGVITSSLIYYTTEHATFLNRPESIAEYTTILPPFIEQAENIVGLTLLMFLAAIGCLFWLSNKCRSKYTVSMTICTVFLLVITFGFPLFGLRNILPSRWFAFMYFFLSIMASCAVLILLTKINKQSLKQFILFIIIANLTFFMITSTISNLDNPLWLKKSTTSTSYTFQELTGAETLTHYSERVFSDSRYSGNIIGTYLGLPYDNFEPNDLSNRTGDIFIWRNYMNNNPIRTVTTLEGYYGSVESYVILGFTYHKMLEQMQKVYANNDVQGYYLV